MLELHVTPVNEVELTYTDQIKRKGSKKYLSPTKKFQRILGSLVSSQMYLRFFVRAKKETPWR